jgi:peptidoglycan/LPS O-acetylase OafA/YrhL
MPDARPRFYPALDGLRAVAVLLVVLRHAWIERIGGGGFVGVAIFFVLSGYLITSVLADEWEARSAVSVGAFYMRRALRLVPALVAVIAVYVVVVALAFRGTDLHNALWSSFFSLTYLSGYASFAGFPVSAELGPTWSLAVEEQFYLFWPLLLLLALRRGWSFGRLAAGAAVLALLAAILRICTWLRWGEVVYKLPTTWIDGLLIGCAVALAGRAGWLHWAQRRGPWQLALTGMAIVYLAALSVGPDITAQASTYWVLLVLIALATAQLILTATTSHPVWLLRPLSWSWMRWVGRRSYAIYLWNAVLIFGLPADWEPRRPLLIAAAIATFAAAELSWRLVEAPARSLKRHFERTSAGAPPS